MIHHLRTQLTRSGIVSLGALLLVASVVSGMTMPVAGQESLNMSLSRNFGMGFGSYIQGTFTLSGSGPEEVANLTVFFNGEQVHFADGNSLSWQFVTNDYSEGSTNITLWGIDDDGTTYHASATYYFIGGATQTFITAGIFALVAVLIIAKYGSRILRLRKKQVQPVSTDLCGYHG